MRSWGESYNLPLRYSALAPEARSRVRAQYIQLQDGLCMYCNKSLNEPPPEHITSKHINWSLFPPNFLLYPVHLQHNHATDLTEGAVHAYCNAVLWCYHGR